MINYKEELNPQQYKVVTDGDGPCLVLAGAGSGKTRTITYRVAYLLEHGVAPEEILLVTFTNKAAREMVDRVQLLTGAKKRLPWAGTFHHIAYKLLKKYASLLGYDSSFSILDSEDSRDLLKLCLKQEGINRKERRFPSVRVVQSIISYARNAETTIEDVVSLKYPNFIDIHETIGRVAEDYRKRKLEANVMDFDDLLVNLYLLLIKSAPVRKTLSEQFRYVLVDEYQDTNKIQASIVRLFASTHNNILVVGDDAQSIYSFRAADIRNILDFEHQYDMVNVFRLETNYRSTPEILDVANDVIAGNTNQYEKQLKSSREGFARPEVHAFTDQREEASFIADTILHLIHEEGVSLPNIAVLFRASHHSQSLEMELAKRDIPYDYRGGIRFFQRAHIKDVLAFLRIRSNVLDTIAWSRVLNMQVGIGPASAQKVIAGLGALTDMVQLSTLGSSLSTRGQVGWGDFLSIWEDMNSLDEASAGDLIRAVARSKYQTYLENEHPDYRDRLQDIEQLALFADKYTELEQFLAEASLQESYATAASKAGDDEERMVLSTVHQAKGLEWDAVFVINLAAGQFPNDRSMREDKGLEEERRLFYVAVTRARKYLYLTYPLTGSITSYLQGPSVFLEDLDRSLISNNVITAGNSTTFFDPSDDVDDITYEPEGGRSFLSDF